jgi:RNA polymerase sigma-70 factor (ECF subfamily)
MLSDEELARDVVQETMITIWQKLKNIKSAEGYRTWIYRIVINKCYDSLRQKKRNPEIRADEKTWLYLNNKISDLPSSTLENEELAEVLTLLTDRLSPKQKAVFILAEIEEMTNDEIADITGIRKSVIKANLYYARKNISGMIGKYL